MYSDGMGNTHVKNATTNAAVTFACQDILRQLQSKCDIHPHPLSNSLCQLKDTGGEAPHHHQCPLESV